VQADVPVTTTVPANAVGFLIAGTVIPIPIATGQVVQIRDASIQVQDDTGSQKLSCLNVALQLLGPGSGQVLTTRGPSSGMASNANSLGTGGSIMGWGTTDWPWISWTDFQQFQGLQPNLRLRGQAVFTNSDVAAHAIDMTVTVIFETWQAFNPGSLVGAKGVGSVTVPFVR